MMNQRELNAFCKEKMKLREDLLTLDGLRQYQENLELADEIAALEAATKRKAAELDAKAEEVRLTISTIPRATDRVLLTLRCKGLMWKEAGAFFGLNEKAAKSRAIAAMKRAGLT